MIPMMNATWNDGNLFNAHMNVDGSSNWGFKFSFRRIIKLVGYWYKNDYLPSVPATNYWYDVFGDHASDNPNYKKLDDLIDKVVTKHLKKIWNSVLRRCKFEQL